MCAKFRSNRSNVLKKANFWIRKRTIGGKWSRSQVSTEVTEINHSSRRALQTTHDAWNNVNLAAILALTRCLVALLRTGTLMNSGPETVNPNQIRYRLTCGEGLTDAGRPINQIPDCSRRPSPRGHLLINSISRHICKPKIRYLRENEPHPRGVGFIHSHRFQRLAT